MIIRFFRTLLVHTILIMLPILFATVAAGQAVTYRLDFVPFAEGATSQEVIRMNNLGMVVGRFIGGAGDTVGYVYDHPGMLGSPNALYLLPDLIDVPGEWTSSGCWGINDHGQVVGYLSTLVDGVEQRVGFVMDLSTAIPTWKYLPTPAGSTFTWGMRINDNGHVVGVFRTAAGGNVDFGYFYHVAGDSATDYELLSDPSSGQLLSFNTSSPGLNNLGQISGRTANGWFRLTPGVTMESIQDANLQVVEDINDWGVLCGRATMVTGTTKRGQTTTTQAGCFYDTQLNYVTGTFSAKTINNSNDMAVVFSPAGRPSYYRNNEGLISIDPMLSANTTTADRDFWMEASVIANRLNERDSTGYPQIAGQATRTTTTGSGKTKVTTYDRRIFILTPELVP